MIIDVRPNEDYENEHIDGAINIPLNDIQKHYDTLPKDSKIYVYCNKGINSRYARIKLEANGFDVTDVGSISNAKEYLKEK